VASYTAVTGIYARKLRLLSQGERITVIELMVSGQENTVIKRLRINDVHIAIKCLLLIKH
jgi:hypothetical protein